MSVGVIVAVVVVGAFVLWETVLPRLYAALRKWRRRAKAKAEKGESSPKNDAAVGCPLSSVQVGDKVEQRTETSVQNAPTNDAVLAFSDCGVARAEKEGQIPSAGVGMRRSEAEGSPNEVSREAVARGRAGSENAKSAYRASDLRSNSTDADRLWAEARDMPHNFIPDPETDGDYLAKIYTAARLGHLEAMVKLGDYAYRRGAVVEAFYWTILAELKGATGLDEALCEMRTRWLSEGCPEEYENAYTDFTEEQGDFARAVLRLQCEVDPQYAYACLKELADRGVPEAQLFLTDADAAPR